MEFDLSTKESIERFNALIRLLETFNDEAVLEFDEQGMKCHLMDLSHVVMLQVMSPPKIFDSFTVPETVKVNISLNELVKRLERISAEQEKLSVNLNIEKQELEMHIIEKSSNARGLFTLRLLEAGFEEYPSPKIDFKVKSKLTLRDFDRAIKNAELVSEHVELRMKETSLELKALGDLGRWEKNFDILEGKASEESKATYTISYLKDFLNGLKPLADVIEISFSTDLPLRIDGIGADIQCIFHLAPCIGV